jgi:hypothetical protein
MHVSSRISFILSVVIRFVHSRSLQMQSEKCLAVEMKGEVFSLIRSGRLLLPSRGTGACRIRRTRRRRESH